MSDTEIYSLQAYLIISPQSLQNFFINRFRIQSKSILKASPNDTKHRISKKSNREQNTLVIARQNQLGFAIKRIRYFGRNQIQIRSLLVIVGVFGVGKFFDESVDSHLVMSIILELVKQGNFQILQVQFIV